jgi:hypothetical protein
MFTLKEVGEMLDMSVSEVEQEITQGYLNYSFKDGEKRVTLYDLEKYMGAEQAQKITRNYMKSENKQQ